MHFCPSGRVDSPKSFPRTRLASSVLLLAVWAGVAGCDGGGGTTKVEVPPRIVLSQSSVSFSVEQGTAAPAPATVSISNGGEGTLSGVSASVTYGTAATGWLASGLSGSTAPSTLTLSISNTNVTPGNHSATVTISGAGASNSPQTIQVSFTVSAPPQQYPDLVVTEVTAPSTGTLGDSIQMSAKVKNQGDASAGTHTLRIYFSTDQTITSSDTYSGRGCTFDGTTDPDEISSCSGYVLIPETLSAGTYYLGAIADADAEVEESNESNNTLSSQAILISEPASTALPDLAMVAITIPGTGSIGDSITVELTIQNHGDAAAGPFRAGVYFSTDETLTTSDTYSGAFCSFQGLSVGGTAGCEGLVGVPEELTPGTYYVGGLADDGGAVEESDEANNDLAGQIVISIQDGPDLTVLEFSAPTTGTIGGTIAVAMRVANPGTVDANAFRVGIYFSTDQTISPGTDTVSSTFCEWAQGMAAGAEGTCSGNVEVPASLSPGTFYVGVFADDGFTVDELNENNNSKISSVTIVLSN
jgi:subtilase family serine protease